MIRLGTPLTVHKFARITVLALVVGTLAVACTDDSSGSSRSATSEKGGAVVTTAPPSALPTPGVSCSDRELEAVLDHASGLDANGFRDGIYRAESIKCVAPFARVLVARNRDTVEAFLRQTNGEWVVLDVGSDPEVTGIPADVLAELRSG